MKQAISIFLIAACLLSGMPVLADDLNEQAAAQTLFELGLFQGTQNGFELDAPVTRAQAVAMVGRFRKATSPSLSSNGKVFDDVPPGHWAHSHIAFAWQHGIAKGKTQREFAPEAMVTPEEFVTFLLRAIGHHGASPSTAFELALEKGVLTPPLASHLALSPQRLSRGDMALVCRQALTATTGDGTIVQDGLKGKQPLSAEQNLSLFLNLLETLPEDENVVFSPFGIQMAFMMAANGANQKARQEIIDAFGVTDLDAYNRFAKQVIENASKQQNNLLYLSNSIWLNTDVAGKEIDFTSDYRKTISTFFDGDAKQVNNKNAVKTINNWISKQTKGKIEDVLSSPDFLSALVNCIYLKADWQYPFAKEATDKQPFTSKDGTTAQTDFMHQTAYFEYAKTDSVQMLEMPYRGGNMSMYLFLPNEGTLSAEQMSLALNQKSRHKVAVSIPKFKIETSVELTETMQQLGINQAFDPTKMNFNDNMFQGVLAPTFLSSVLHKALIEVDEKGTEAAAATTITVGVTSFVPEEEVKQFVADKPFVYLIQDNQSGAIYFMGTFSFVQS